MVNSKEFSGGVTNGAAWYVQDFKPLVVNTSVVGFSSVEMILNLSLKDLYTVVQLNCVVDR